MSKSGTISRLALRLVGGGLIGGVVAIVAWIVAGFFSGLVTGLPGDQLGDSIRDNLFQGAINGILWAPLGALGGAICALLRFFWLNTSNKRRLIRVYVIVAAVALASWPLMCFKSQRDEAAVRIRYLEFCSSILEDRYQDAYLLMSPDYRQTHSLGEFQEDPKLLDNVFSGISTIGCDLDKKGSIGVFGNRATVFPEPSPVFYWYVGPSYDWKRIEGEWYFTGESVWSID